MKQSNNEEDRSSKEHLGKIEVGPKQEEEENQQEKKMKYNKL